MRRAIGILADCGALGLLTVVTAPVAVVRRAAVLARAVCVWVPLVAALAVLEGAARLFPCRSCGGSGERAGGMCEACEGWGL